MRKSFVALALLAAPIPALAESLYDGQNEYLVSCSAEGYELVTKFPVTRLLFGEIGADGFEVVQKRESIELAPDCSATHSLMGAGTWCAANGGVLIEFQDLSLGFPRQALFCPAGETSPVEGAACGC